MPRFSPIVNLLYDLQKEAAQARSAFLNGLLDVNRRTCFLLSTVKKQFPLPLFSF